MLGLPKSTEVNKPLYKKDVYKTFDMDTKAKERFDKDVSKLYIANEISPASVSIASGEQVGAIFVLRVVLKDKIFSEKTISGISKLISQKMVMVLEYESQAKLAVYYKKLYRTEWQPTDSLTLRLTGLDFDAVWDNIVKAISGVESDNTISLDESLAKKEYKEKIQKEIKQLEKQAWKEKQPKKKFELVQKINKLKTELGE